MGVLHPNKVGDIFTTQPNENNIHIIVELPTSPSGKRKNEKSLSQWNSGWIRTEEKGPRYSCLSSHYRAYRDKYSFKFCRFLVLTDLNDCWIFYWLSNDRTVMMFRAIDSSNALDIIGRTLDEDSISTATTTIDPNFPIGSRINFCHLGNLQGEASENVDLFFNRPKVQFEFEDDVANMKDMFDEMTEEEIKGWKVRRVIKLFG
ncbi:uncharacterized protein OCT59_022141 [Rhizophagus irregularis]|uniref:Crinkler family protein n=1 Tax=Rhizophagus irregularis (strain DAOM 181602 / DAOM 197198 / MUCL 43194) TaxID=747089 RepID=A0A2H5UAS4_RHIID|nr:hypothetical protein GLOIN_2v1766338 [Rhizophagus irregularis DAOM 181602=DAOM 197198]POG78725.1 hypothetical protein GLOIN_2v1766338 [Rhizophagus irregularis DAOM 181602=DAOM 197198]UZO28624.1 hypothetical protein OCT59_022141 [Rhizophagus irregularis]|eukprot:XP_025185591.1 hypothetical protein GLOIN_2v1766338 [Rhizophagus irregularis DAOM 181602=DAOM 197198]